VYGYIYARVNVCPDASPRAFWHKIKIKTLHVWRSTLIDISTGKNGRSLWHSVFSTLRYVINWPWWVLSEPFYSATSYVMVYRKIRKYLSAFFDGMRRIPIPFRTIYWTPLTCEVCGDVRHSGWSTGTIIVKNCIHTGNQRENKYRKVLSWWLLACKQTVLFLISLNVTDKTIRNWMVYLFLFLGTEIMK